MEKNGGQNTGYVKAMKKESEKMTIQETEERLLECRLQTRKSHSIMKRYHNSTARHTATHIDHGQDEQRNESSCTNEDGIASATEEGRLRNDRETSGRYPCLASHGANITAATEEGHLRNDRETSGLYPCLASHGANITVTTEEGPLRNGKKTSGLYSRLASHISSLEKKEPSIKMVHDIFNRVENLLRSREFQPFASEIFKYSPNLMHELQKRRLDLKKELCIIIAGETSGGKSTLVNRLVGRKIFKPSIDESTATICRIRNSNDPKKISCKVVGKNDQVIDERSFESGQDEKIRKFTEENVDKNAQLASMEIDHVDVGLYFPFLKGNTLIVDTPGIGGSRELSDKMMKYLPNAVAFIFVSNVANAGGVQRDRLVKIIQEVVRLHDEKDITCLDPRNALFISNKWDAVPQDERDEGWSKVQRELKKHWPHLTSENIFRTSLMSTKDKEPDFDAEFERFKERLAKVVERSQYTRQIKHLTFLKETLKPIEVNVKCCLNATSMSKETRIHTMERLKFDISQLQKDTEQRKVHLKNLISNTMLDLSQTLLEELKSEKGKHRILNPPDKKEITSVHVLKVAKKVKKRILTYITKWNRGETVIKKLEIVHKAIEDNFSNIHEIITNIESELKGSEKVSMHEKHNALEPDTPILVGIVASAPIWIPILAAAGTLCVVAGFILSPIVARQVSQWNNQEKKMNVIDKAYDDFVKQYTIADIKPELDSTFGVHYNQLLDRLFTETTEKQISYLIGIIMGLEEECAFFHNKKAELEKLCNEIDRIKISLYSLSWKH